MDDLDTDPVSTLVDKLRRYPQVRHRPTGKGYEIDPPNEGGFKIALHPQAGHWIVSFGEGLMHEEFSDPTDTLEFIAFGLSDHCRLREVTGPFLRRSFVDRRDNGTWVMVFEVGTICGPGPSKRENGNSRIH